MKMRARAEMHKRRLARLNHVCRLVERGTEEVPIQYCEECGKVYGEKRACELFAAGQRGVRYGGEIKA